MKLAVVVTSQRIESQSLRVGARTAEIARELGFSTDVIDTHAIQMPFFDTEGWSGWAQVSATLKSAQALVVVTPEWSGMASPAAKNFFLYCQDRELDHKPGMIISVSAGLGGSYPIAELRMSSYKNTGVVWIPEHLIVRRVETEFEAVIPRLRESLGVLKVYADALRQVQTSDSVRQKKFLYGM